LRGCGKVDEVNEVFDMNETTNENILSKASSVKDFIIGGE
jgi:hypothetical protein